MKWYDMINDMIWYLIWHDIWYMIWCDMIWYDMIWYDLIWFMIYDMIWYDMIWYDMIYLHYMRAYVCVCVRVSIQSVFTFHESTGPDSQGQGVSIVTAPHSNCFDTLCAQTTPQWLLPIWIFQRSWNEVYSPNFQPLQKQRQTSMAKHVAFDLTFHFYHVPRPLAGNRRFW